MNNESNVLWMVIKYVFQWMKCVQVVHKQPSQNICSYFPFACPSASAGGAVRIQSRRWTNAWRVPPPRRAPLASQRSSRSRAGRVDHWALWRQTDRTHIQSSFLLMDPTPGVGTGVLPGSRVQNRSEPFRTTWWSRNIFWIFSCFLAIQNDSSGELFMHLVELQ